MSQDMTDLLKVMLVTLLVFAAGAFVMFMITYGFRTYGAGLPLIGDLPDYAPPSAVPMLVDIRFLIIIGACFLTASGIALLLTSTMLDMALLVFAKAVTVLITAAFGIFAGTWGYVRLMDGSELSLASLNRPAIALVAFFVFASVLRLSNLRQSTPIRLIAAIGLILLGPIVLVSL